MCNVRPAADFEADSLLAFPDLVYLYDISVSIAKRADRAHTKRLFGWIFSEATWKVLITRRINEGFDLDELFPGDFGVVIKGKTKQLCGNVGVVLRNVR